MSEYDSGAYFVRRGGRRNRNRNGSGRSRRAAGVLITVLLILTAAICALVALLPRLSTVGAPAPDFDGKTFYMLAIGRATDREQAQTMAQYAVERGGAGYIYNDGEYKIVAAVYDKESDAKTLTSVNENSYYFELTVPKCNIADADARVVRRGPNRRVRITTREFDRIAGGTLRRIGMFKAQSRIRRGELRPACGGAR